MTLEPFKSKEVSKEEIKEFENLYKKFFGKDPFEEKDVIKIFLAEPSGGQVDIICEDNRKDLFFELGKLQSISNFRFFSVSMGRTHVSFARETFADMALKEGMDWILFFDDDQILPKGMFLSLAQHMSDADIIAPLIIQRVPPHLPVYFKMKIEEKEGKRYFSSENILDYPINSTFSPEAVGFGVILLRTDILLKMPRPWFFSNVSLGEDLYFCQSARRAGFRILADTRIKVGHLGVPEVVTEIDFIKYHKDKLKVLREKELSNVNKG